MAVCHTTLCPRCDCPVLTIFIDEKHHNQFCYNCGLEYINGDIPTPSYGLSVISYKNGIVDVITIGSKLTRQTKEEFKAKLQNEEVDKDRSYLTELNYKTFQVNTIHFRK